MRQSCYGIWQCTILTILKHYTMASLLIYLYAMMKFVQYVYSFFFFFSSATSEKKVQIKSQNPREKIWQGNECRIIKFVFRSSSSYSKCFVIYNIRNQLEANCEFFSLNHFHENSGVILFFILFKKRKENMSLSQFHFQKKITNFVDCLHFVLACDDISPN